MDITLLRTMRTLSWIAFLITTLSCTLLSQDTSTISGLTTDPSGAAVPNVVVTLTNADTGFARQVASDGQGRYVASAIPTGEYTIEAKKEGFQTLKRSGVR